MTVIKQTKMNSIFGGKGGAALAPEATMPAEVWDVGSGQVGSGALPLRRWQVQEHNLRCYRETFDDPRSVDASSSHPQDQRASVLMGALLGLTMFVAVLISGDFGESDWHPAQGSNSDIALSYEDASAPQL